MKGVILQIQRKNQENNQKKKKKKKKAIMKIQRKRPTTL